MSRHVRFALPCSSRFQASQSLLILILPGLLLLSGCAGVVSTPVHAGGSGPTALSISVSALPSGQTKSAYSTSLAATGGTAPYAWSVSSGSLPSGLSLSGSGQISGTPSATGTSSFMVSVTDSSSPVETASGNLSITITAAATTVQITTSSLAAGQTNTAYSAALAATGGTAPYAWSVSSGSLPAGLTLSSAGQISGTPTTAGTSSFTVAVSDSSSPAASATANLGITIAASATSVHITTSSLSGGVAKTAYSATLAASGGKTPYSWSISSGSLPVGLTLSASGQISGTPTTAGTSSFTVKVADSSSPAQTATANLSIPIAASGTPLQITTSSLPSGIAKTSYSATLAATGGKTSYSWSVSSGSLPTGLTLSTSGQMSGTPTSAGTFSFTVKVTDSSSPAQSSTANLSITISASGTPVQVTTSTLAGGQTGASYSATLAASGGKTPYSWSVSSGSLPTGLSLNSSGQISGTPTSAGTFSFTVKVTDSSSPGQSATANLSITITLSVASLQITTSALPTARMNTSYSATLAATGGKTPYSWSVTGGSLPTGLSLSAATGVVSGTSPNSGVFGITFQVKDSSSPAKTAAAALQLTIDTSSSSNCPTGQPCGASAAYCQSYSAPSTSGATPINALPYKITSPGNYYLASDLSSPGVGIAVLTSSGAVDVNLNGHTLTFGTAGTNGSGAIGAYGILMCNTAGVSTYYLDQSYGSNGYCLNGATSSSNVTVENGTILQSPNAPQYYDPNNCPGSGVSSGCANPHPSASSHAIASYGNSNLTVSHVTLTWQNVSSDGIHQDWTNGGNVYECDTFNDMVYQINARSFMEGTSIGSWNSGYATKAETIRYNSVIGGPQNGIVVGVSGSTVEYNDISLGHYQLPPYQATQRAYTNDYAIGSCPPGGSVSYNYIHNVNGRGIGCVDIGTGNQLQVSGNYVISSEENVNGEYGPNGATPGGTWAGGCELEGARGIEFRSTNGVELSGNTVSINSNHCGGAPLRWYSAPCATDISCSGNASFNVHNNVLYANNTSGSSTGNGNGDPVVCYFFGTFAGQTSGFLSTPITDDSCTSDGDFAASDWDMAQGVTFVSATFARGSHPITPGGTSLPTAGHLVNWGGGAVGSGSPPNENGWAFQDMSYQNGESEAENISTPSLAHSATISWSYTLTVLSSKGGPLSGASVSITDAQNSNRTGITNSSGQVTFVLVDHVYQNTAGSSGTRVNHNPNTVTIGASGCSSTTYGISITSTTADSKTLTCQ
jgi:hypothetical protein